MIVNNFTIYVKNQFYAFKKYVLYLKQIPITRQNLCASHQTPIIRSKTYNAVFLSNRVIA